MRALFTVPGARLCAVVGQPIAHSKSPLIHRLFAEQCGIPLQYERIEVEPGTLPLALATLRAAGCHGVNVTVPLKEEAANLAVVRNHAVLDAHAANTLWWTEREELVAANTDGIGLVQDLTRNLGIPLAGCRILLIGAGGAAAGVIGPLLGAGAAEITLTNRNAARAAELAGRFATRGAVSCLAAGEPAAAPFDLVINATSAGLRGECPPLPRAAVGADTFGYDLFYAAAPTPFLAACKAEGAGRVSDGLGMLVEQAAAAFQLWHGREPASAPVLRALRG